jgi:hypothetical protein
VSGDGRFQREHIEEPTAAYRLEPIEETKAVLDCCAWRCAMWREKRVSAMAAGIEKNGGAVSSPGRKTATSRPTLLERHGLNTRWSGDGRVPHHHQVDDDPRQVGPARVRRH